MKFINREVEYPNRIELIKVEGKENVFDIKRAEGNIIEPGTPLNAGNLNLMISMINENMTRTYPVGSIYFNAASGLNPAEILGFGTWEAFGKGRVLVGAGTSDQEFLAGTTGGESKTMLTVSELPQHSHSFSFGGSSTSYNTNKPALTSTSTSSTYYTDKAGNGMPHNNLQPYIVVYMWKRTA